MLLYTKDAGFPFDQFSVKLGIVRGTSDRGYHEEA